MLEHNVLIYILYSARMPLYILLGGFAVDTGMCYVRIVRIAVVVAFLFYIYLFWLSGRGRADMRVYAGKRTINLLKMRFILLKMQ